MQILLGYYLIALDRYIAWLRRQKRRPIFIFLVIFGYMVLLSELNTLLNETAYFVLKWVSFIVAVILLPFFFCMIKEIGRKRHNG